MSKGMKEVLQDELLFLTFVCNCTQRDWYFELLNSETIELYTYNSIGVKVSHILECDSLRHVLRVKNTNSVLLYTSDAMSLVSVAQWFCTERAPQLLLPAVHADFEMLERVLHGAYRIEKDDSHFDFYSEIKDVLVASGMIEDAKIYVPGFNSRAIDSAEDCYKLLSWLNTKTVASDSNGTFALDWATKIFNEMYSADGKKYVRGLFKCVGDVNVVIENNQKEGYYLVSSGQDAVTATKLAIFETVERSGLNLIATPVYREPSEISILKNQTKEPGEPRKSVLDDEFKKTDELIDEVYDVLYTAVVKSKSDASSLPDKMEQLKKSRSFYLDNLSMDERCLTYINKINVLFQEYKFYAQIGFLEVAKAPDLPTKEQARQSKAYDTVDSSDDTPDLPTKEQASLSKMYDTVSSSYESLELPTKEQARQSEEYDSVESNDEVPDLPTKEQARQSNDFDEVAESSVPQKVQDLIDGEVTSVDVRRLIHNGRTIAYRFKTNLGYYDMSVEAADKYGLSEGSVHFDKGILVDLKNGLFLTQREIRERRLVREVSNNEVCCEKLVNAVFTL